MMIVGMPTIQSKRYANNTRNRCATPCKITDPGSFSSGDTHRLSIFRPPRYRRPLLITPPDNCLEASTGSTCRGFGCHYRYCHPPPLRPEWVCQVHEVLPILLLLPPARNHLPVAINKQGSSKIMPTITGVCYIPPEHRKPPRVMVKKTKREIMIPRGGFFTSNTAIAKFTARESACIYNSVPPDSTK